MGDRIAVMRNGLLQQLDTPQALYDRPANAFVAGFIGSPTMNMLDMEVHREDGDLWLTRDGLSLPVPPRYGAALDRLTGTRVRAGLRPEDLTDHTDPEWASSPVSATVDVVEPLGSEAFVYATAAGQSVIARVNARASYAIGAPVTLQANLDHLHLFDESGANLVYPAKDLAGVV